ncbi:MAG: hypothetical protein U0359_37300 [Byssovorax sp.]
MIARHAMKLAPLFLLLAAACGPAGSNGPAAPAAPPIPKVEPGHFIHRGGGSRQFDALVSGTDITGPTINLTLYSDSSERAIRGQVSGLTVDVEISGNRAHGLVGPTPLDVTVTRKDQKIHVDGVVRGAPTDFDFGPDVLDGKIGNCTYHLTQTGKPSYNGSRGCGGGATVEVEVPEALRVWGDAELAATLGLMLSAP